MTSNFITIRGYAIPFNRTKFVPGNGVELIDRNAFSDMIAAPHRYPVAVRWLDHDDGAHQVASKAELFVDDFGLGFKAALDMRPPYRGGSSPNWNVIAGITRSQSPIDQCSVGDFAILDHRADRVGGIDCNRVLRATIGHITICSNAVYGDFTGVWRAHCDLDLAPARIQRMASTWDIGFQAHRLRSKRADLLAGAEAIAKGRGLGPGGDLSASQMTNFWMKVSGFNRVEQELALHHQRAMAMLSSGRRTERVRPT